MFVVDEIITLDKSISAGTPLYSNLAPLPSTPLPASVPCTPVKKSGKACMPKTKPEEKEKEYNMGCEVNLEVAQRDYLRSRARDAKYTLLSAAATTYGQNAYAGPRTKDDLKKALQEGYFEISPDAFNADGKFRGYGYIRDAIRFTNPEVKKDDEGYKKATKAIEKAYVDVKDAIMVKSLEDGLKALQVFEAQTF